MSYLATRGALDTSQALAMLSQDDGSLVRALIAEFGWSAGDEAVAQAQAGDEDARSAVIETCKPHLKQSIERLLAAGPELGPELASLAESILAIYSDMGKGWSDTIDQSAASTRQLADVMAPRELIEYITSGLDYEIPLGMTRLVAVPSVTLRPWTLVTEFEDALVVSYSVDDDHLSANPDGFGPWVAGQVPQGSRGRATSPNPQAPGPAGGDTRRTHRDARPCQVDGVPPHRCLAVGGTGTGHARPGP